MESSLSNIFLSVFLSTAKISCILSYCPIDVCGSFTCQSNAKYATGHEQGHSRACQTQHVCVYMHMQKHVCMHTHTHTHTTVRKETDEFCWVQLLFFKHYRGGLIHFSLLTRLQVPSAPCKATRSMPISISSPMSVAEPSLVAEMNVLHSLQLRGGHFQPADKMQLCYITAKQNTHCWCQCPLHGKATEGESLLWRKLFHHPRSA